MKKYFDKDDFITFLENLEVGKETSLFIEHAEAETEECKFLKVHFCVEDIILCDTLNGAYGIIQDTPVAPWIDHAEFLFEAFENNGESKVFIKDDKTQVDSKTQE